MSRKKDRLMSLAATAMIWGNRLVSMLPRFIRYRLVGWIGVLYSAFDHGQKSALRVNLQTLFNYDEENLQRTMTDVFQNFVITLYDFFNPHKIIVDVPDRAQLEAVRKKYGGVMMLTFHMGNWELGARTMARWGWPVTAVFQPYENKKLKRLIESRRAPGVNFIPVGQGAAGGVREALKRGDVVAMLGDHAYGEDGIPVTVLGHRVLWPKGPVLLAARQRAPIVIAVITRVAPRHYHAYIEEPIIPQNRTKAEVERMVQEVADKFSKLVAQYPTQWYRFEAFHFVEQTLSTKF